MHLIKYLSCCFLLMTLLTTACKKDDDNSDKQNYFFCKLDGENWESDGVSQPTIVRLDNGGTKAKRFDFYGKDPLGPQISITVQDYENADQGECLNTGKYYGTDHADASDNYTTTNGLSNFAQLTVSGNPIARDGFVEITDCGDGKISGRFSFVVKDLLDVVTITISDGRFDNVAYTFSE
jgi:hypothetical protein